MHFLRVCSAHVRLAVAVALLTSVSAYAATPQLINYQGVLTNPGGTPQVGTFSVTFAIYQVPAGGFALWAEPQSVTTDADGRFSVLLGSATSLSDTVFDGPDRWLGVAVSPDGELVPRTRIASVAYSERTSTVDGAAGGNITSKVSIGPAHVNTGAHSFVAGESNSATGDDSFVAGARNAARGEYSVVSGGGGSTDLDSNSAGGNQSAISGGYRNTISPGSGTASSIGGGFGNFIDEGYSTIGGGSGNVILKSSGTIAGGEDNTVNGTRSTVGGGEQNTAAGHHATVGGGEGNVARDTAATVSGGEFNDAAGLGSAIPGGVANSALGVCAFASGHRAKANHSGTFVWADSSDEDFASTADEQFLIRASGGVGIGTAAPSKALEVAGSIKASDTVFCSNLSSNSPLRLQTAGTTRMYVDDATGKVRIGPGTPLYALDVVGTGGYNQSIYSIATDGGLTRLGLANSERHWSISNYGTTESPNGAFAIADETAGAQRLVILENGNVGIGTLTPNYSFEVAENAYVNGLLYLGYPSSYRLTLPPLANDIGRGLANGWYVYSSRRWKTNINTITDAVSKVGRLRGVEYDHKEGGVHCIGLIAEEVGEIIPEVVDYEDNGADATAIDYARLVALLIEGMKEQQQQIEELKTQVADLRADKQK